MVNRIFKFFVSSNDLPYISYIELLCMDGYDSGFSIPLVNLSNPMLVKHCLGYYNLKKNFEGIARSPLLTPVSLEML